MHLSTPEIIDLLFKYRYLILFPIAFLEGPAVAVIAGFMIAIKFMNFWPAYIILVSANILGDITYYSIGRLVPRKKLDSVLSFFRIKSRQVKGAERMFVRHRKLAIIFGKIAHAIGSVFLIAAGIVRIPLSEYLEVGTLIELPKALIFVLVGYYFGHTVTTLNKAIDYSIIGFVVLTIAAVALYHFIGKYTDREIEKIGNI